MCKATDFQRRRLPQPDLLRLLCFSILLPSVLAACTQQLGAPVAPPVDGQLPLARSEIQPLGVGPGVNTMAWLLYEDGSRVEIVYDRIAEDGSYGRIMLAKSSDGGLSFSEPTELDFGSEAVQGSVSVVHTSQGDYLYFLKTEVARAPARFFRCRIIHGSPVTPEEIRAPEGLESLLAWPRVYALEEANLAITFRDARSRPMIAFSRDGKGFGPSQAVAEERSAMPALGLFSTGELAYVYQTDPDQGPGKISWVRISKTGRTWSKPQRVSSASPNIHDSTLVRRKDGSLDIYYSYTCDRFAGNFSIFRRRFGRNCQLGSEQRVTACDTGSFIKPSLCRLANGKLLLLVTSTERSESNGGMHLSLATLRSDAPWLGKVGNLLPERGTLSSSAAMPAWLSPAMIEAAGPTVQW